MVGLGMYFIAFFALILFLAWKRKLSKVNCCICCFGKHSVGLSCRSGGMDSGRSRSPALDNSRFASGKCGHIQIGNWFGPDYFLYILILFTVLLIAEIGIMLKAIQKGPEEA